MGNKWRIRLASEADSASVLQIYAPYITETAITFECQVPTDEEFRGRMAEIQRKYPWLVCEVNGHIVGYAYASSYREREAYQWSVSLSVYVDPRYQGQNIGSSLYYALLEFLKKQGFYSAYASVAQPNVKSERLQESFGLKPIGIYKNAGYKLGQWLDVKWFGLVMQEPDESPTVPQAISEIENTDECRMILEKAAQMIREKDHFLKASNA